MRTAILITFLLLCATVSGQESHECLDVSLRAVAPVDPRKPEIIVTYTYTGNDEVSLSLPTEREVPSWRGVNLFIDGQQAEYVWVPNPWHDYGFSNLVFLENGEKYELRLDLSRVYKIPKSWKTMKVVIRRRHILMKEVEELPTLVLKSQNAGQRPDKQTLDVSIKEVSPIDASKPKVILTYSYSGDTTPLSFNLPDEEEMRFYRGLDVRIDGKTAEHLFAIAPEFVPKHSRMVELRNGEEYDFRVDLSQIYKIPKSWGKIEVRIKKTHSLMENLGSLVLSNKTAPPTEIPPVDEPSGLIIWLGVALLCAAFVLVIALRARKRRA